MAPAKTPTVDEALDSKSALIYSPKAPLAGKFSPTASTSTTPPPDPAQIRKDDRAVWACVSSGFDPSKPEVLIYLHGHNYYVTAQLVGGSVVARVPDWMPATPNSDTTIATNKGKKQGPAGHFYGFDALSTSGTHHPLVLLPEDGHHAHDLKKNKEGNMVWDGFWCKESSVGTLSSSTGLDDVVEDCLQRLFVLPTVPPGQNYLTKELHLKDLKRLYLTGHSGGGVPLNAAIASHLALNTPTTVCFLDATYSDYRANIRNFCETWLAKSHLGTGTDDSCLVIVYNPASGTENWKTTIVADLNSRKKTKLPKPNEVRHRGPRDLKDVQKALKSDPILVIHTDTAHEDIPKAFTALLLENP